MQYLKDNDLFIVVHGDKNLGPCILERNFYIYRGFAEHLGNTRNYKQLDATRARTVQRGLQYQFLRWLGKYRVRDRNEAPTDYVCLDTASTKYLKQAFERFPDKLARYRQLCKIHKISAQNPQGKMRPIIACAGTFMNYWSKWLDFWLQTLKSSIPTYLKNGDQVLDDTDLIQLPPWALLFTCDATSMYNNIDTDHAIEVITWWLKDLFQRDLLPENFPLDAVLSAMIIIMRNNLFEFGDLYFLQLLGTAMGTSAAVMWATIYYAYHEVFTLIPKHGHNLLYFKRYIDDIFGIWTGNLTTDWEAFSDDVNNFGILKWDITETKPSTSVNFLDMNLSIEKGKIISRTFQKAMSLHLYIPPASEHTLGTIKGTIYGLVLRYFKQNTYQKDFVHFVGLLYYRLLQRGWERKLVRDLILGATDRAEEKSINPLPSSPKSKSTKDILFLHFQYHKDGITRQEVRKEYETHLETICKEELGIQRMIVAFSTAKNIGNYVSQTKLHQAPGKSASSILGEFKSGLNPY